MRKLFINILYLHIQYRPHILLIPFFLQQPLCLPFPFLPFCFFFFFLFFYEKDIQTLLKEILNQFTPYFLKKISLQLNPNL